MNMTDTEKLFLETYIPDTNLPQSLAQKVHVVSCLSSQNERQVHLLRDERGHLSILKTAWGSQAEFLEAEAGSLENLRFSFLPQLYSVFRENGRVFLWREYIDGDTLWERVERSGPFDVEQAVEITKRICSLVAQLHGCTPPVIHRDLKPQNLVLTREQNLFLIDMETIHAYREGADYDTFFIGTRRTAAPEQYGYRQTDCRTDVYAIGILFLYLLTGSTDLQRNPLLDTVPEVCREIIGICTKFDPDERYQSCGELEKAVSQVPALAAGGWSFRGLKTRRVIGRGLLAAVCLCALCAFGAWHFQRMYHEYYHFQEPMIEQAVCLQLEKEPGTITKADLERVTELRICGTRILEKSDAHHDYFDSHGVWSGYTRIPVEDPVNRIVSVEDCAGMKNLHTLILDMHSVTNLSPLAGLPLQILSLGENPVVDLSALADSASLTELDLFGTRVRDITPLSGLSELTALDLEASNVEDIAPLAGLPLSSLRLPPAAAKHLDILSELPLRKLYLHYSFEGEEEIIGRLTELEELSFFDYGCDSLEPLQDLDKVTFLSVTWSPMKELKGFSLLSGLRRLSIDGTQFRDLSELRGLPLTDITMADAQVLDLSFLADLPELRSLYCDSVQAEELYKLIENPPFEVTVAERSAGFGTEAFLC